MEKQPEALRLADLMNKYRSPHCGEAAAELRRLHAQRDEMLAALKMAQVQIENECDVSVDEWLECKEKICAAIAKATGQ